MARFLGPEQLGLATTLVVTAAFFDLVSDTGADRFLVQDRHGDTTQVQNLVQLVYVSRGILVAAALVVFAVPVAHFYNAPKLAKGLMVLAFSPLIFGFLHLDIRRIQRDHDFRTEAICLIAAEGTALLATAVAAWATRDFTAALYGLITRACVQVALSHLLARRPYRLGWDRDHAPRLTRFAAPLMMNGLVLFIVSQGDRVIVGNQLGVKSLGYYSVVIMLVYYPSVALAQYIHTVFIPMISRFRDLPVEQLRTSDSLGGLTLVLGVLMVVGFAIVAPPMVPILFGARFNQAAMLVGLIGILQVTRFMLFWPTTVALAMGRSSTVLVSNLAHIFAVPAALVGLRLMGGLAGIVTGYIVGEIFSVAIALVMLNRNMASGVLHGFDRLVSFLFVCGAIVAWSVELEGRNRPAEAGLFIASVLLGLWLYRRESAAIGECVGLVRRVGAPLLRRSRYN